MLYPAGPAKLLSCIPSCFHPSSSLSLSVLRRLCITISCPVFQCKLGQIYLFLNLFLVQKVYRIIDGLLRTEHVDTERPNTKSVLGEISDKKYPQNMFHLL